MDHAEAASDRVRGPRRRADATLPQRSARYGLLTDHVSSRVKESAGVVERGAASRRQCGR
jgi:hypothetical protein